MRNFPGTYQPDFNNEPHFCIVSDWTQSKGSEGYIKGNIIFQSNNNDHPNFGCFVDPRTGRIRAWINHNAKRYDIFVKFDSINEIDPEMYPKDVRDFILNNIKE